MFTCECVFRNQVCGGAGVILKKTYLALALFLMVFNICHSQEDIIITAQDSTALKPNEFNVLSPAKAAFYSAILPGLGQAFNKKYWKIPLVYGALGTGIYYYTINNKDYNRARDAYKLRLNGKPNEFDGLNGNILLTDEALIRAQKSYKKERDLSLLVTVGLYVIQILEASTNAHLLQHNVDDNLTFSPKLLKNDITNKTIVGASFNINF